MKERKLKMKNIKWRDKYIISISENCSAKDIQKLMEININRAREIKRMTELECKKRNIVLLSCKVPTEIVLDVIGRDTDYYYRKMIEESKVV